MAKEVRFTIDEDFIQDLQSKLKSKPTEIARDALTLLNWAVEEAAKGRVILSTNQDGRDIHRLTMPTLNRVAKEAQASSKAEGRADGA